MLLPACQPAADEQPTPRPTAPAALTVADARSWYESAWLLAAPSTAPAAKGASPVPSSPYGPPLIRWNQAVQLARQGEMLVLAPLADSATSFAVSGHQGFRYLVTFQTVGQPLGGFILEVLSRGGPHSPAQMQAILLQLYDSYTTLRLLPPPPNFGLARISGLCLFLLGGLHLLGRHRVSGQWRH